MKSELTRTNAATGRLGVLVVGMGSLATSLIAGVHAVRRKMGMPIGSLTQMGYVPGANGNGSSVPLGDAVPLARLGDLVFGGWDVLEVDAYSAAKKAAVLDDGLLSILKPELESIRSYRGVHDPRYLRKIQPTHRHSSGGRLEDVEHVIEDIRKFREESGADRLVLLNSASTETFQDLADCHRDLKSFEKALAMDDERISPAMIYAYAALAERVPVVNCTPSRCVDLPALLEMAEEMRVPIAGRDLKTGQTLLKTILAPGLKVRALGLSGWYSTNILGNRDGEVLDDPASLKSKQESKLSVLNGILEPEKYPDLYGNFVHQVRIDYYPPRKDNKEAWDNIDIFGWLGYQMQIKVNFLCRDSILAAPLALDLILLTDLAMRTGHKGAQEWLSLFFKSPIVHNGGQAVHDLFEQRRALDEEVVRIASRSRSSSSRKLARVSHA